MDYGKIFDNLKTIFPEMAIEKEEFISVSKICEKDGGFHWFLCTVFITLLMGHK